MNEDSKKGPIERMTEAEFDEFMETPRTCTRCKVTLKTREFPMTTARGVLVFRSWCSECLRHYYRVRSRQKWREQKASAAT